MRNLQTCVAIGATEAATGTLGMTIGDEGCPTRDEKLQLTSGFLWDGFHDALLPPFV